MCTDRFCLANQRFAQGQTQRRTGIVVKLKCCCGRVVVSTRPCSRAPKDPPVSVVSSFAWLWGSFRHGDDNVGFLPSYQSWDRLAVDLQLFVGTKVQ